ncbi:MAG: hypothetical protein ACRDQX_01175 [Pseudonocardiaceae bacterium]
MAEHDLTTKAGVMAAHRAGVITAGALPLMLAQAGGSVQGGRGSADDGEYHALYPSAEEAADQAARAAEQRRVQAGAYTDDELYGLLFGKDG